MNTTSEKYIRFFEDQIRENELEYKTYLKTSVSQLLKSDEAYLGNIVGTNEKGHIILKIPKGHTPRLKLQQTFCILRGYAFEKYGSSLLDWNDTCKAFLEDNKAHTIFSTIIPLYFLKNADSEYDYLGCSSVLIDLYNSIEIALSNKRTITFVMIHSFPPIELLSNLAEYIRYNQDDKNLLIQPKLTYEDWSPEELSNNDDIPSKVINTLDKDSICILQGPPGTGKSYTIAQVAAKYINMGKSVCVTTMSNKGLIELISKDPLDKLRENGKIYKTLLTADEEKQIKGVLVADKDLLVPPGVMLCSTYYILSKKVRECIPNELYDLIVIEEASQAYLATIAAFSHLGKQCLIVGDPMQLPPIILNEQKYNSWGISPLFNGLRTIALGSNIKCYRMITSRRLTFESARLTGVFYNNSLKALKENEIDFSNIKKDNLFPRLGGSLLCQVDGADDAILSNSALDLMKQIVSDFETYYKDRSIAIISPFKDTVQKIQKIFYHDNQKLDITVETIDRIQGLTFHYTILYFPLRNISFALSDNRFNVATSRSASTTLIISDMPLSHFTSVSGKVMAYLGQCKVLSNDLSKVSTPTHSSVYYEKSEQKVGLKIVGKIDLAKFERKNRIKE
jgi:DNA replication ATP-dependent helicase Dna2